MSRAFKVMHRCFQSGEGGAFPCAEEHRHREIGTDPGPSYCPEADDREHNERSTHHGTYPTLNRASHTVTLTQNRGQR